MSTIEQILKWLEQELTSAPTKSERVALYLIASERLLPEDASIAGEKASEALSVAESLKVRDRHLLARCLKQRSTCKLALGDLSAAIDDLSRAEKLFTEPEDLAERAAVVVVLGEVYTRAGDYRAAMKRYNEALRHYTLLEDSRGMAGALKGVGALNRSLGDFPKALENFLHSLKIVEDLDESIVEGDALCEIAIVYGMMEDYGSALDFFTRALDRFRCGGEQLLLVRTLVNIAGTHYAQGSLESALKSATMAMAIYEALGNSGGDHRHDLAMVHVLIGNIYEKMEQYRVALDHQLKAYAILKELGDERLLGPILLNIGNLNRKLRQSNDAIFLLDQTLLIAQRTKDRSLEYQTHAIFAETLQEMEGTSPALYHYKLATKLRDELQSQEKQKLVAEMQIRFDVERAEKEREIFRLKNEHLTSELNAKMMSLIERDGFIKEIDRDLTEIEKHSDGTTKSLVARLLRKLKASRDPAKDWKAIESRFTPELHDFMQRLKKHCPALNASALKFCALMRAGLRNDEIGALLDMSQKNMQQRRFLIKKKLGLGPDEDLQVFLDGV